MPSMPTFNVSNTKPTFTEISYTKLRTFPQPFAAQKQPNRIVGDLNPSRGEFVLQGMQRQMRCLANPFSDESAMRLKHRLTVAAHLAWRY